MRSIVGIMVLVVVMILVLGFVGAAVTLAEEDVCPLAESVQPGFNPATGELTLIEAATGTVTQVLAAGLPHTEILGWSPDCQTIAAVVGPMSRGAVPAAAQGSALGGYMTLINEIVLWDVASGERAVTFELPYRRHIVPHIDWAASTTTVTVLTGGTRLPWPTPDSYANAIDHDLVLARR